MPDEVKRVAAAEAQELLSSGRYTYLDVRTPEEFAAGHAVGAVNVPLMLKTDAGMVANPDFLKQVKASFPDTEQQLVVGCKAGNRSLRACAALSEDYPNLVDNAGGFDGWLAAKLPVAT